MQVSGLTQNSRTVTADTGQHVVLSGDRRSRPINLEVSRFNTATILHAQRAKAHCLH